MIIGIDEVGRGCWAGPLVACAVEFDDNLKILGLRDSKKMSKLQREKIVPIVTSKANQYALGWVWPKEINNLGLTASVALAMKRAIEQMKLVDQKIVIDGNFNFLKDTPNVSTFVKADDSITAVAAASVLAKVARDKYMKEASITYPGYLFEDNAGYGTKHHIAGLEKLGLTPLHRRSFAPIKKYETQWTT